MAKQEALHYIRSVVAKALWPEIIKVYADEKDGDKVVKAWLAAVDVLVKDIDYDHLLKMINEPSYIPLSDDNMKYMAAHLENGTLDVDDIDREIDRLRVLQ
jgi:hypothetical protein